MAVVALWVKLDSPGAVFYRQERVGRFGVPFRIHKFRTMREGAGGLQLTVGEDPRITRVGHFLRRTRLDELPQFIDVLQGTMSLVGPRPEVPRYVALYPAALRERALAVRPGLTDPASLAYIDEARLLAAAADPEREYVERILPVKVQAAVDYAESASLAHDLAVLARTAWALLRRA
jgi:lipopolysaccharide/colanic/teichoic acid biosynthesis glycosyltransferase